MDAFIHDRLADADGETYLVPITTDFELAGLGGVSDSYITPSGRYVYFDTYFPDIINGNVSGSYKVYRYDLLTKKNTLISNASGSPITGANGQSRITSLARGSRSDLSGDFVYSSTATNLTSPGDWGSYYDAFVSSNGSVTKSGRGATGDFLWTSTTIGHAICGGT